MHVARQKAKREGKRRAPKEPTISDLFDDVVLEQALWEQFFQIGGDLNPGLVSAILREADAGRPARLVDLTHELRQKDGTFHSVCETREKAVSELPWTITVPENSRKKDEKAAKRIEDSIRSAGVNGEDGFVEAVEHLVGEPVLFGHGTVEVIAKVDEADGLMVPERFKRVGCRRFGFRQSDGRLLFDPTGRGNVDANGVDLTEFSSGKFLNVRRRINGDVLIREGLARCAVWMCSFRNWDLKDWLAFAELAWKPWRRAAYDRKVNKEDRRRLAQKLARMASTGVLIHPKDIEVMVEWPKGAVGSGQSGHKELADHLAAELTKAFLGGTLMVDAGNRGARSLGEVQDKLRLSRRDGDVLSLCAVMTHQFVRPFARMNYGPKVAPLTFIMQTDEGVDQAKFAEAIETYGRAGLRIPSSYVYDQAGIPPPDGDEEVLEAPSVSLAKQTAEGNGDDQEDEDGAEAEPDAED